MGSDHPTDRPGADDSDDGGRGGALVADHPVARVEAGGVFRADLGDIGALAESIRTLGLLSPIVVTADRLLVSGRRRLAAVGLLGWETIPAWVAQGVSGRLRRVLAIRDCEELTKALTPIEQAELYAELEGLYAEEAARRRQATQFRPKHPTGPGDGPEPGPASTGTAPGGGGGGPGESPGPPSGPHPASSGSSGSGVERDAAPVTGLGEARVQAARRVTGTDSHQRLERINELRAIAADAAEDPLVREAAADALVELDRDGKVAARWERVKLAQQLAALRRAAHDPTGPDAVRQAAAAAFGRAAAIPDTGDALREAKQAAGDLARARAAHTGQGRPPDPDASARRAVAQLVAALRREHGWWERHDPAVFARLADDDQFGLVAACAQGVAGFWQAAEAARNTPATG